MKTSFNVTLTADEYNLQENREGYELQSSWISSRKPFITASFVVLCFGPTDGCLESSKVCDVGLGPGNLLTRRKLVVNLNQR